MRKSVSDVATQAVGNYVVAGIRVVRGLVLAGVLGPAGMGVVATGNLLLNYTQYSDLGASLAAGRDIPSTHGSGRAEEVRAIAWHAVYAQAIAGIVVALGVAVWLMLPSSHARPFDVRIVLFVSAITSVFSGEFMAATIIAKSQYRFRLAAAIAIALALLNLSLGLLGAWIAGPVGAVVGTLISYVVACALAFPRLGLGAWSMLSVGRLRRLVSGGWSLALLTFVGFNLENIDQVIILWQLTRTDLGQYVIVLQVGGLLTLLGLSVSSVVGPRLLNRYAIEGTATGISHLTWLPAHVLSAVAPLVVAVLWMVVPWLVGVWLPEYVPAMTSMRVYLCGMYFLCITLGVSSTLLAFGKHRLNVPIMAACIGFNVGVDLVLLRWTSGGILAIATGSLLTYALYWAMNSMLVRAQFEQSFVRSVRANLALVWPGLVLVAMLLAQFLLPQGATFVAYLCYLAVAAMVMALKLWPERYRLVSLVRDEAR